MNGSVKKTDSKGHRSWRRSRRIRRPAERVLSEELPLERLAAGDVILAYEMNGEPLTVEHGAPVRLFIPVACWPQEVSRAQGRL